MKRTIITVVLTFALTAFAVQAIAQTAFSGAGVIESTSGGFKFPDGSVQTSANIQLGPVLHDADDVPIGYVVSIETTSAGNRVVRMVSGQGYLAEMSYSTVNATAGPDYPGFRAYPFYESADCTGDPVLLRATQAFTDGINNYGSSDDAVTFEQVNRNLSRLNVIPNSFYANGDLIEFEDGVLYVPFDAEPSSIWLRSIKYGSAFCEPVDRCSEQALSDLAHLVKPMIEPETPPPGGFCPGEIPSPDGLIYPLIVDGFRLSSLLVNDPAITGFQSTAFKRPFRIKFIDIEPILAGD